MTYFVTLTNVVKEQSGAIRESPIRIEAATIFSIERFTLEIEGNRTALVTAIQAIKGIAMMQLYVRESPDTVETAVEKAMERSSKVVMIVPKRTDIKEGE
jgi:hypothetical protein